jgi:putative ABC transport system substrate-binding protein
MAKKKTRKSKKAKLLAADIGIIHSGTKKPGQESHISDFKEGLRLWSNENPRPVRWSNDKHQNLRNNAKNLIAANVTLLVAAGGSQSAIAAGLEAMATPIIVTSISDSARPSATMAGICARTSELDPKRLELLLECLPGRRRVGALYNSARYNASDLRAKLNSKANVLGIPEPNWQGVDPNGDTQETQIDDAFQFWTAAIVPYEAAVITADPLFNNHIDRVVANAAGQLRTIPAIYQWREFAEAGGLMSYGPSLKLAYKLAGTFAGLVASGKKTVDQLPLLPLESFELVINLNTAQSLGIEVPYSLLARATDVII